MTAEDMTMQALRKEVSELTLRLKELGDENRDLREICNENGIQYAERLAARRHKRYFEDLCATHPLGRSAEASDVLGAVTVVQGIAGCAGSVLRTGSIARCFFEAFTYLTERDVFVRRTMLRPVTCNGVDHGCVRVALTEM